MEEKQPLGLESRIIEVDDERGEDSVETFVKDLQRINGSHPVEQRMNEAYENETVELYGGEYAPFMFTKGMPLKRDEHGARYREGIVPLQRKKEHYRDPVRCKSALTEAGAFERGGLRPFIGVPGVHTVALQGMDSWRGIMPPAPDPTGAENAAEMIDVYAMEQLRDVPFTAWPNEPGGDGLRSVSEITAADSGAPAALKDTVTALDTDLGRVGDRCGDHWYGTDRLFVEAGTGSVDWWGPYVSQFLLHEVNLWALPADQEYLRYESGRDYNQYLEDWLNTLEGKDDIWAEHNPSLPSSENRGYIATPRHLATIVNAEPPYQEYLIAALRLLGHVDFDPRLPYATPGQDDGEVDIDVFDYTDSGPVGLFDVLARVCRQALLAAFYQKYYVHFRCRPETYGGRVHAQRRNWSDFQIPALLTESAMLEARTQETDYLSTAYVEGSPVHPAYPSGHSVIAGACGTVLKTWFEDDDWPEDLAYYVPTHDGDELGTGLKDLTEDDDAVGVPAGHRGVAQEVDKLVSNVGLARMFAGVHYYSDHKDGVKLGEQIAVGVMADVFERSHRATGQDPPTFTPYLEYDNDRPVSEGTLEDLRKEADAVR